jgi:hypothetical protein
MNQQFVLHWNSTERGWQSGESDDDLKIFVGICRINAWPFFIEWLAEEER